MYNNDSAETITYVKYESIYVILQTLHTFYLFIVCKNYFDTNMMFFSE
jgi:hypothetical protein